MNLYYVNAQRQPTGPVTREQLDSLLRQGVLSPATLVTREGDKAWIPYRQLEPQVGAVVLPTIESQPTAITPASRPPTASITRPPTSAIQRPAAAPAPSAPVAPTLNLAENPYIAAFTHPTDLGERLMAIGGAVGLVSYMLPWIQVSGQNAPGLRLSSSGWSYTTGTFGIGSLLLIPAAAITAIVIAGKIHTVPRPTAVRLARIPLAVGAAAAGILALVAMEINRLVIFLNRDLDLTPCYGLWLTVIAFIAQVVGAWIVIGKRST